MEVVVEDDVTDEAHDVHAAGERGTDDALTIIVNIVSCAIIQDTGQWF